MKRRAIVVGVIGLLSMAVAAERMLSLPLWSYWPLVLGLGFALLWVPWIQYRAKGWWQIGVGTATGLYMGGSFYVGLSTVFSFICLVPLLFLVDHYIQKKKSFAGLWGLSLWSFFIANVLATFWVMNTALAAGIFANVVNAALMTLPLMAYAFGRRFLEPRYHWITFLAAWLLFEFFHFNWDLHWPWMTLGYALSDWTWAIQWYEFTGVLGGSLWILLVNWFAFLTLHSDYPRRPNIIAAAVFLIVPIVLSQFISAPQNPKVDPVNFLLVQPNFEPHYEKFDYSEREQLERVERMVEKALHSEIDLLVLPETVFTVRLDRLEQEPFIQLLRRWKEKFPDLQIMTGLATRRVLDDEEENDRFTRTSTIREDRVLRWEAGNVAMFISEGEDEIYYKSQLVPGAEFFPYYELLFVFEDIARSLGGSMEGFRTQEKAEVFEGSAVLAPIICYESIFGDYCRNYVAQGAEIFTIITNDGWWDDTPGHRQHLRYAQVRAIEHRRPIARAANTGISAFINPRGKILEQSEYGEEAILEGQLIPGEKITFYSRWGDLIGRLSLFVMIVLLMQLAYRIFASKRDRGRARRENLE
jgi:apolipoprotein N-acyltransferase